MKRFIPATIFGIAFGILEGVVVVYLRRIYYPDGFTFPLVLLEPKMISIEIIREISTIVMLGSIAFILGKTRGEKFSFFIFTFAVWDIFYYVALKLFLNWPESLLTWDVLFLIPVTWIGPVLAPIICSFGLILISLIYVNFYEKNYSVNFGKWNYALIILGVLLILYTFLYDYTKIIIENDFWKDLSNLSQNQKFWEIVQNYVPRKYNWFVFGVGCLIIGLNYAQVFIKSYTSKKSN